jgi:hypothetical protein
LIKRSSQSNRKGSSPDALLTGYQGISKGEGERMEKEMSIIKKLLTEKFGNAIRLE